MLRYFPLVLALASMVCAGCADDDLGKVKRLADEMCACKDVACSEAVIKKGDAMVSNEVQKRLMRDHEEEFTRTVNRLVGCLFKLEEGAVEPAATSAEMPFLPSQKIPEFPSAKD